MVDSSVKMLKEPVIFVILCFPGLSIQLSHSDAFVILRNAGISVASSGRCINRNHNECTSLQDIRETSISGVISLKLASSCEIVVTGGTEARPKEHSGGFSHKHGYKLDIRKNGCITHYIYSVYEFDGSRPDGTNVYLAPSGNLYNEGKDHWCIVFRYNEEPRELNPLLPNPPILCPKSNQSVVSSALANTTTSDLNVSALFTFLLIYFFI